jgi:mannosyltransferase
MHAATADSGNSTASIRRERSSVKSKVRSLLTNVIFVPTMLSLFVFGWGATTPSLWGDELATWDTTTRSWHHLTDAMNYRDVVMFPYYALMFAWTGIFGDSELALRAPSVIAMVGAVAVTALLATKLFGNRAGLYAGLVLVAIPSISRNAHEARVYAFVVLLAVVVTYVFTRSIAAQLPRSEFRWWVGYAAAVALLGAAHLLALTVLVVHALVVLSRGVGARSWRTPIGWLCATVIGVLPTLWLVRVGSEQRTTIAWLTPPKPSDLVVFPGNLFGVYAIGAAGSVAMVIAGTVLILAAIACRRLDSNTLLLAGSVAVPVLLLVAISLVGPVVLWHPRYLLFVVPFVAILAGKALTELPVKAAGVVALVVLVFAAPIHVKIRQPHAHAGYDARAMSRVLGAHARPSDAVMFSGAELWHIRNSFLYYVPADQRPQDPLVNANLLQGRDVTDAATPLASFDRVWLVRKGSMDSSLRGLEPGKSDLLQESFHQTERRESGHMTFTLFERNAQ